MKRFEVIFFDLDHTLIDTRRQYEQGLAITLRSLYGDQSPSDFAARFMFHNEELWPKYDQRRITMKDLRRERFLVTWRDYGVEKSVSEAEVFQETYNQTFETTLTCFPGTLDMLSGLVSAYRLGIITNGSPDLQARKLAITGLSRFFDTTNVIVSEDIGWAKPHPLVYETACDRLATRPEKSLMIGDNYRNDVLGARNCGLHALWYGPDPDTTDEVHLENETREVLLRTPEQVLQVLQVIKMNELMD